MLISRGLLWKCIQMLSRPVHLKGPEDLQLRADPEENQELQEQWVRVREAPRESPSWEFLFGKQAHTVWALQRCRNLWDVI